MKNIFFLITFFVFQNIFLFGQTNALNFFGFKYALDTNSKTYDLDEIRYIYPVKPTFEYSFIGKTRYIQEERITEDPYNPGVHFFNTEDTITNKIIYWNVIDTLNFNQLHADSSFNVVIGKKKYPICEFHVVCDSLENKAGCAFSYQNNMDIQFQNTYNRNIMSNNLFYFLNNSNHATRFFITDIYYFDQTKMKKVKLELSILIKK